MKPLDHARLSRLAGSIRERLPFREPDDVDSYPQMQADQRLCREILADLVADEDASLSTGGGTETLRLAGVRASCTWGPEGLLRAWLRSAEKKAAT